MDVGHGAGDGVDDSVGDGRRRRSGRRRRRWRGRLAPAAAETTMAPTGARATGMRYGMGGGADAG
eukprot:3707254-Pleurochrysis_carterae.AAC.1